MAFVAGSGLLCAKRQRSIICCLSIGYIHLLRYYIVVILLPCWLCAVGAFCLSLVSCLFSTGELYRGLWVSGYRDFRGKVHYTLRFLLKQKNMKIRVEAPNFGRIKN